MHKTLVVVVAGVFTVHVASAATPPAAEKPSPAPVAFSCEMTAGIDVPTGHPNGKRPNISVCRYDPTKSVTTGKDWRFTAPRDGFYRFDFQAAFETAPAAKDMTSRCDLYVLRKGSATPETLLEQAVFGNSCEVTVGSALKAGDQVYTMVAQTSGSGLKLNHARILGQLIGP